MKFLIIADDDSAISRIPAMRAEVLIACGDLAEQSVLQAAERCQCERVLAVKGNHDSVAAFPAPVVDLHLRTFAFRGITFGGFGGSWRYKPLGHHLFEQSEVQSALKSFPRVDVFIAHNSPARVHVKDDFVHVGFEAFDSYIARHQPRLFLHGHQHVEQETWAGETLVIGSYGYRLLEIEP